jgi:hypothetical protein
VALIVDFFIPDPTIPLFGVENFFPVGVDPARDVSAEVSIRMLSKIMHPDGSIAEDILLDYGMRLVRDTNGALTAIPSAIDLQPIEFLEPDGSFGFVLPALDVINFVLPAIGPGDILEFSYDYFATASTGFGETGVFAAIGDPFNLSTGGGRVDIRALPPSAVPEPATLATFGLGLVVLGIRARRRRRPPLPSHNC